MKLQILAACAALATLTALLAGRPFFGLGAFTMPAFALLLAAFLASFTGKRRLFATIGLVLRLIEALDRFGRCKPIIDRRKIVVFIRLRGLNARLIAVLQLLLGCRDNAEIVLSVLQIILGKNRVARGLGVAGELEIFLRDVRRITPDFHIRSVGFEVPAQRVDVLAPAIVVPAALAVLVVLVWSHRSIYAFKMSLWVALFSGPLHQWRP